MKIIIITTENEQMKETGFGHMVSCQSMKTALEHNYTDVSIKSCSSRRDLENVLLQSPDIAVLAVKYILTENNHKIWLSDFFEAAHINFTGSSREVLEYDSNKILAKNMILSKNIPTASFTSVTPENLHSEKNECLPYPQFVKPLNAANGNGIDDDSLVYNFDSFIKKSNDLFDRFGHSVISEKYLSGREFTVAVLHKASSNEYVAAPMEIVPPLNKNNVRILGEIAKLALHEDIRIVENALEREQLIKMAIQCFVAFEARDFGRVDIKMDENGVCNFVEVNLVPGMTRNTSYFPNCFKVDKKMKYEDVILQVIENAVHRNSLLSMNKA